MATSKFGAAYKAARDKGEKEFTFNGKKYTTESREEKADRMATNQRQKMAGSAAGAGRGSSAGRGAEDSVTKEREPIRMEGLERMKRGLKELNRSRNARIEMDKVGRMAAEDDIGMGMKKGGKVAKGMHRMPDGRMMKDSEHKKPKKKMGGGMMKYRGGGCVTKKMKPTKYV